MHMYAVQILSRLIFYANFSENVLENDVLFMCGLEVQFVQ